MPGAVDWTEKYRPHSLAELVGNGPAIRALREWAEAWVEGEPKQRAVILAGQAGVGKTSAAMALAADMGWAVIELNASDGRNADTIRRVATAGAIHQTFASDGSFHEAGSQAGRKLIILDEADNLYERLDKESAGAGSDLSDRGGKRQIIDTIRQTHQPIVLIVNDLYALQKGSGSALRSLAETIKFTKVNVRSIPKALERIAREEGIRVDRDVLEAIAVRAEGDLRAAVRDLESLCAGRTQVTAADLGSLGFRDITGNMFDLVRHVLKGNDIDRLRREAMDVDATPEEKVLWVDENLPKEFTDPGDLVRGYDMLSRADRFLGRARRSQNFRLWAYAGDLATLGVQASRQVRPRPGAKGKFVPFGFPQYLMKMSRTKASRQNKAALAEALGHGTHMSRRKAGLEQVQVFETLFRADREFAIYQTLELELTDDQVALLLEGKATDKDVKAIRAEVDKLAATRGPKSGAEFGFKAPKGDDEQPPAAKAAKTPKVPKGQSKLGASANEADTAPARPQPGAGQSKLF